MNHMPSGSLQNRLIQDAAAGMGTTMQNIAWFIDDFELAPSNWAPGNVAGGVVDYLGQLAGAMQFYTAAGGTDAANYYSNTLFRNEAATRKVAFAGRVAPLASGTSAAGARTWFGWSNASQLTTADALVFGNFHSGSATNFVVAKYNGGTPTYVDTGVALDTAYHTVSVQCNGTTIRIQVDNTVTTTTTTGWGSSLSAGRAVIGAENGGVLAARALHIDYGFWAVART